MAGPVFWIFIEIPADGDEIHLSRMIARAACSRGFGATFGAVAVGCWDAEERAQIELLERELKADFVVSITDHPLQTSAFEIFNSLVPARGGDDQRRPDLPSLIQEVSGYGKLGTVTFVISRDPWMAGSLPRHRVSVDQFVDHTLRYHLMEADSSSRYGGDGVFKIDLQKGSGQ